MNNLLLDSHIFLWAMVSPRELSKAARHLIETTPNVYVSALSVLELKVKEASGKLKLPLNMLQTAEQQGLIVLDLTVAQLSNYRIYQQQNSDPFDNALLAVAETQHCRFLTIDERILSLQKSHAWIVDGR